ncbi:hypothetical protein ACWCPF_44295, partial [Streptomyces sp. NPDC001858]
MGNSVQSGSEDAFKPTRGMCDHVPVRSCRIWPQVPQELIGGLGRVKFAGSQNLRGRCRIVPGMRQINVAHVARLGLAVVEVAAAAAAPQVLRSGELHPTEAPDQF